MAEPLNYARKPGSRKEVSGPTISPVKHTHSAVPPEFDAEVTRSEDHPAISAIENSLRREKIRFARSETDAVANRSVILFVRAADLNAAQLIAARIFMVRAKLKKSPKVEMPDDSRPPSGDLSFYPGML